MNKFYLTTILAVSISIHCQAQISKDSFNLFACKKMIKDAFIKDILIINKSANDTFHAPALLDANSIRLSYKVDYAFLLIGRKRYNYFIDFAYRKGHYVEYMSFCLDKNAKHTRKNRISDVLIDDGINYIGSWSVKIPHHKR